MANIVPADFSYKASDGSSGQLVSLSDADIKKVNSALLDIEELKLYARHPLSAGSVLMIGGDQLPDGFLLCNGALVSRTTYAGLFAAIGETYGAGDGKTTFALPDYRDRALQGASAGVGVYTASALPAITGITRGYYGSFYNWHGCYYSDYTRNPNRHMVKPTTTDPVAGARHADAGYLQAAKYNALYGASDVVQPPALAVSFIIKV